jgi:20S proteasome subunit alpha 6
LLDIETPDTSQANDSVSLSNGHHATQDFDLQLEHLPEPPASPAISSMACEDSSSLIPKGDSKAGNTPSANRLSISYARSNRRLAINAEVVETLKLFRQEGRIEVMIKVQKQEDGTLRGILVGLLDRSQALF